MIRVTVTNTEQTNPRRKLCVAVADAMDLSNVYIARSRIGAGESADFNLSRSLMLKVFEEGVGPEEAAETLDRVLVESAATAQPDAATMPPVNCNMFPLRSRVLYENFDGVYSPGVVVGVYADPGSIRYDIQPCGADESCVRGVGERHIRVN